jgi:hypothetical protein
MSTVYTPPKNDAYTVLLGISLGALVLGCLLLFLDWSEYSGTGGKKPPAVPAPAKLELGEPAAGMPAPGLGQPGQQPAPAPVAPEKPAEKPPAEGK